MSAERTHTPAPGNLYLVQHEDGPMWVVADSFARAVDRWTQCAAYENGVSEDVVDEPQGVQFVCKAHDLILGDPGVLEAARQVLDECQPDMPPSLGSIERLRAAVARATGEGR
jgi:hypothetical protein